MSRTAGTKADEAIDRPLTANEVRWARTVFGATIDYKRDEVHNSKAYFFDPVGTAVTPKRGGILCQSGLPE